MEKESLILLKESSAGIAIAGIIVVGLILLFLISAFGEEQNPQQKAAAKFARREKQFKEKEETLKHIEKQLKTLK